MNPTTQPHQATIAAPADSRAEHPQPAGGNLILASVTGGGTVRFVSRAARTIEGTEPDRPRRHNWTRDADEAATFADEVLARDYRSMLAHVARAKASRLREPGRAQPRDAAALAQWYERLARSYADAEIEAAQAGRWAGVERQRICG